MTDLRKAAEMALEALEEINKLSVGEKAICLPGEIDDAMEALRQALAEPEQVLTARTVITGRAWVGLTVDEARKFYEKYTNREELIYAIDEFLEEKNSG